MAFKSYKIVSGLQDEVGKKITELVNEEQPAPKWRPILMTAIQPLPDKKVHLYVLLEHD